MSDDVASKEKDGLTLSEVRAWVQEAHREGHITEEDAGWLAHALGRGGPGYYDAYWGKGCGWSVGLYYLEQPTRTSINLGWACAVYRSMQCGGSWAAPFWVRGGGTSGAQLGAVVEGANRWVELLRATQRVPYPSLQNIAVPLRSEILAAQRKGGDARAAVEREVGGRMYLVAMEALREMLLPTQPSIARRPGE